MSQLISFSPKRSLVDACSARMTNDAPLVSVVIPVFNNWRITQRCLKSLLACDPDIAVNVVVVDDASNDETAAELAQLPGIQIVRNGTNSGFVKSCNRGAALARGEYILFLNNDTELTYGSLRTLVRRIERSDEIAIVGSKLVYPDGRLQEAGNIIWGDATGWNYGRHDQSEKSEYNFSRDVDYVSAASLLIRKLDFQTLGGFDTRFAPGYYEDADLCFAARESGRRVVYEPASVVVHHEGATAGTDITSGMKRFQTVNHAKFIAKWAPVLQRDHIRSKPENVYRAARLRHRGKSSVLIIDSYVPQYDKEAGSNRLKRLIDGLRGSGVRIIFFPDNLQRLAPYAQQLESDDVEVIYSIDRDQKIWQDLLVRALSTVDAVWICRPDLCSKYLSFIREHAKVPIIYDTIDLHHLRLRRQSEIEGHGDESAWRDVERLELACAHAADRTVVVSDYEAEILEAAGVADVGIVPTIHNVETNGTFGFRKTSGILFIGGYNHHPNVDAVRWLVNSIMPIVWASIPDAVLTLLGSNPPPTVLALANHQVIVPGYLSDSEVAEHFRSTRVFVAPLRYGAGLKGKVGQALAFGTPIVTTPIGVEGLRVIDAEQVSIALDEQTFAAAIVQLYRNEELWNRLSTQSPAVLRPFYSTSVVANALAIIENVILKGHSSDQPKLRERAAQSELDHLQGELRASRRREANSFLKHRQAVAELMSLEERFAAKADADMQILAAAKAEIADRNARFELLLTLASTLNAAITDQILDAKEIKA